MGNYVGELNGARFKLDSLSISLVVVLTGTCSIVHNRFCHERNLEGVLGGNK